eukprot:12122-Heterococcus_DN1.PRE.8
MGTSRSRYVSGRTATQLQEATCHFAARGHVDMLKWLKERGCGFPERIYTSKAASGVAALADKLPNTASSPHSSGCMKLGVNGTSAASAHMQRAADPLKFCSICSNKA